MLFLLDYVLSAFKDAQIETVKVPIRYGKDVAGYLHFNRVSFHYNKQEICLLIVEKENDYFVVI